MTATLLRQGFVMIAFRTVVLVLVAILASCEIHADDYFPLMPKPSEVKVTLGQHRVVMPNGHDGLTNFPDMPIVELSARPLTFLVVGGIGETFLMRGDSYERSRIVGRVLPPGPPGSVDNQYAGISCVFQDKKRRKLIAFYHAEDGEQMPKCSNNVCGAYWSLCVAESPLDKLEFTKLGRFITADQPKKLNAWETEGGPREAWLIQGTGNPWVMPDVEKKHLLCFYIEASNRLKERRGCQICMARAPIESAGLPGSWKKYFQGDFSQPGLGGHDTPVITASPNAETADPFVLYVKPWKRYVMFMMMAVYTEMNGSPPAVKESGFYISTSVDALEWTKPVKIATLFPVPSNGRPCSMRPHLVAYTATARSLKGTLRYAHSEDWGRVPQYLAESPITITFSPSREGDDIGDARVTKSQSTLADRLQGTKWIRDGQPNNVFEWTNDGRLLQNGGNRKWKVLDDQSVEIRVPGKGGERVDRWVFADDLKTVVQHGDGGKWKSTWRQQGK